MAFKQNLKFSFLEKIEREKELSILVVKIFTKKFETFHSSFFFLFLGLLLLVCHFHNQ
jgi:hypothetical protein